MSPMSWNTGHKIGGFSPESDLVTRYGDHVPQEPPGGLEAHGTRSQSAWVAMTKYHRLGAQT